MSSLLDKALEKVVALPPDEQDAIASQILASLADEEASHGRPGGSGVFFSRYPSKLDWKPSVHIGFSRAIPRTRLAL